MYCYSEDRTFGNTEILCYSLMWCCCWFFSLVKLQARGIRR